MDLKEYLSYNEKTGIFVWKKSPYHLIKIGDRAGGTTGRYRRIQLKGKTYQEHRVAWLFIYGSWPKYQIDHINGNGHDNRIENLRSADAMENAKNKIQHRNGKNWGVHFVRGKWHASFRFKGKNIHVGIFENELEAKGAVFGYLKGAKIYEHFF